MTLDWAASTPIPFGKHKGRKIGDIGRDDGGLRYLDWLVGEIERDPKPEKIKLTQAIKFYLKTPAVADRLNHLIDD